MSARHRLPKPPKPDGDGVFAGIVLLTANLLGLGVIVAGQTPHSASAAVALDAPPAQETPDAGPVTAKKDSGPAHAAFAPEGGEARVPRRGLHHRPVPPGEQWPGRDGTAPPDPPDSTVNFRGFAAPYESGSGSSNRPRNAITDV
ncbi:hypothetical protein [Streptomyces broussonetiae]|uniref:Uncharacterized protein n=1 Tax=Streptomyces broussonetiae TaxID=2686304 RepID=A0ABV5EMS3_9ACTN